MSSYPKTQSALIVNDQLKPEIATIPVFKPLDDQILIRVKLWALGASSIPITADNIGAIYGFDNSGVVIAIGKDVKGFAIGDHVAAAYYGGYKPVPYQAAFAQYVNSNPDATFKFDYKLKDSQDSDIAFGPPETFETGSTLAMSLITAGIAFYYALDVQKGKDVSQESIIIYSAGSAIGVIAVQLAKWLGFKEIIVTASPSKFALLESIGATGFFNYKDADLVDQIKSKYGENITYGIDTYASPETVKVLYDSLSNTKPIYLTELRSVFGRVQFTGKSNPTHLKSMSAFYSLGDYELFGKHFAVPQGFKEVYAKCKVDLQKLVNERKIKVIQTHVLEGGLSSLIKGLEIVNGPRSSNEKLVARA